MTDEPALPPPPVPVAPEFGDQLSLEAELLNPARQAAGAARRDGSDTMRAAARSQLRISGSARMDVLRYVAQQGYRGATDAEVEQALGMRHQTASARRRELVLDGWLTDSGRRRTTDSGRKATVWVLTDRGTASLPL